MQILQINKHNHLFHIDLHLIFQPSMVPSSSFNHLSDNTNSINKHHQTSLKHLSPTPYHHFQSHPTTKLHHQTTLSSSYPTDLKSHPKTNKQLPSNSTLHKPPFTSKSHHHHQTSQPPPNLPTAIKPPNYHLTLPTHHHHSQTPQVYLRSIGLSNDEELRGSVFRGATVGLERIFCFVTVAQPKVW